MARVVIIGFAGGHCPGPLTPDLFARMVDRAEAIIRTDFALDIDAIELVSGGAPWGDHVAVTLFLRHKTLALTIFAPCEWDATSGKFADNGRGSDWKVNPAHYINKLHAKFATITSLKPFDDILDAVARGATVCAGRGFHSRNTAVADAATHMIAFSWGDGDTPDTGGTRNTWDKCSAAHKVHVPMSSLVIHSSLSQHGGHL